MNGDRRGSRVATAGLVIGILLLAGCSDRMQDLRQYVAQVKARKGGAIPPLPQIKPFETFTYEDANLRSPFVPQLQTFANAGGRGGAGIGIHPNFNRPRQYLEQFPLDSLKMMGTLRYGDRLYALVRDGDGVVHRVSVGNYMGQNYGKIIAITDNSIKLREIVPDGQGRWMERMTTVQLGG